MTSWAVVPVAVTYCPLCNSGWPSTARVADEDCDLRDLGAPYADNLVMYDRQTQSLWPHSPGEASSDTLTGTQLVAVLMGTVRVARLPCPRPAARVCRRTPASHVPTAPIPTRGTTTPTATCSSGCPMPRCSAPAQGTGHRCLRRDRQRRRRPPLAGRPQPLEVSVGAPLVLRTGPGNPPPSAPRRSPTAPTSGPWASSSPVVKGERLHFEADSSGFRDRETGGQLEHSRTGHCGTAAGVPTRGLPTPRHVLVRLGQFPRRDLRAWYGGAEWWFMTLLSWWRTMAQATRPVHPITARVLAERWAALPRGVRTRSQSVGRHAVGCEGTHGVFPKCNLTCSPCYHSKDANKVRVDGEHTVAEVTRQMAFLRQRARAPRQRPADRWRGVAAQP